MVQIDKIHTEIRIENGKVVITLQNPPPCWKAHFRYCPVPSAIKAFFLRALRRAIPACGDWFQVGGIQRGNTIVVTPNTQSSSALEIVVVACECSEDQA